MKSLKNLAACCGIVALAGFAGGCREKPKASSTGAANVQEAFKKARPDVREFADQAVAAESRGELSTAFVHYRALSINPELTPEQRNSANESMLEMSKKLREASGKGDAEAEKVLQQYRATK